MFDNVKHEQLLKILRKTDLNVKDICIVTVLYWGHSKIGTGNIEIKRGVRQGCISFFVQCWSLSRVLVFSNIIKVQNLIEGIKKVSEENELNLNITKTKLMIISRNQQPARQLIANKQFIEHGLSL